MQTKKVSSPPQRLLLRDNKGIFKVVNLSHHKKLFWRKKRISLDHLFTANLPGHFIVQNNALTPFDLEERRKLSKKILGEDGDDQITKNNMEIIPDEANVQPLKEHTIVQLKKRGELDAHTLVDQISKANKNFDKRTRFSKEKYREKKLQRHSIVFRVERLSLRNINGIFFLYKFKRSKKFIMSIQISLLIQLKIKIKNFNTHNLI